MLCFCVELTQILFYLKGSRETQSLILCLSDSLTIRESRHIISVEESTAFNTFR